MKRRVHPYISELNAARLQALGRRPDRSESSIVDEALTDYFERVANDERDAAIVRRLDRLTRQFDRLEQKDTVLGETLALFVRYFLMVTPQLPTSQLDAARARGDEQFDLFLEQLARDLQGGKRVLQRAVDDVLVSETAFFTEEDLDRLNNPAPPRAGSC